MIEANSRKSFKVEIEANVCEKSSALVGKMTAILPLGRKGREKVKEVVMIEDFDKMLE